MKNKFIRNTLKIVALSSISLCYSSHGQSRANNMAMIDKSDNKYSYIFSFDKHMSNDAISDISLSSIELYRQLDEKIYNENSNFLVRAVGYFTRLYIPLLISTANHEIGGHGGRAREFKLKVSRYQLSLNETGATYFLLSDFDKLNSHQQISIDTGGMQANHILAEKIKDRFMNYNIINPTYSSAYFFSQVDQAAYIFSVKKDDMNKMDGDDIAAYVRGINKLYGTNYLSVSKLKNYAYLDLVDPFLYYSIYSYSTNNNFEAPMIQLGNVKYIPALRLVLAPYGIEKRLVNHFKYDNKYIKFSLAYGKNKKYKTHSIDLSVDKIYQHENFSVGLQGTYWYQPKLLSFNPLAERCKIGGYGAINSEVRLNNNIASLISFGYKSNGFKENLPLKKSFIAKIGIKLDV